MISVKYLPDQPPEPVPGRIAQDGAAGPFLRGGRLPVDRRGGEAVKRRAAFSKGTKDYRFGDGTFRTSWDDAAVPGSGGVQKIAGSTVVSSMRDPATPPPPPTGAPSGIPYVSAHTTSAPSTLLFTLAPPPDPSWLIFVRLSRAKPYGYAPPSEYTAWLLGWDGAQVVSDYSTWYADYFGALVAGYQLTTQLRLQDSGAWGPTIGQQFWLIT